MAEVRLEIEMAHPPERVWRALTDAELLADWFMPTDLEPTEGHRFTLEPGTLPGFLNPVSGELTEVAAPRRLVMLWQGDKLYTRVSWELTATGDGCRLELVQSGFIGAPAALRRRALRATYTRLFGERLPAVLDRLAADEAATADRPARAATGVPRQRRPRRNVADGAWSAGRTLHPPTWGAVAAAGGAAAATEGAAAAGPAAEEKGAAATAARPPRPRRPEPDGPDIPPVVAAPDRDRAVAAPAVVPAETVPPGRRTAWFRWRGLLAVLPGWLRAMSIAGAAALLVLMALAVVSQNPSRELNGGGAPGGRDAPAGPGMAWQPGVVTSRTAPAGLAGEAPAERPRGRPAPDGPAGSPAGPSPAAPTTTGSTPGATGPPEVAPTPDPPAVTGSVLTAELDSTGLPLLGARAVTVTVSNPGPGVAADWEVVVTVGDQRVTDVSGADHERDGSQVIFTSRDELAEGAVAELSFDIPAGVLGLLGASDPTGCTIDGRPCQ